MNDLTLDRQDNSGRLDQLTEMALIELRTILGVPLKVEDLDPSSPQFKKAIELAKLKLGASDRILNTQVRVDETRLKARTTSRLPEMLQELLEMKAKRREGRLIEGHAIETKPEFPL
jgi:hypothetical protein